MHNMISDDNDDDNNSIAGSRNNHPQDADLRCYSISVAWTPHLMNSARLHKVFQNFVVQWKIHI